MEYNRIDKRIYNTEVSCNSAENQNDQVSNHMLEDEPLQYVSQQ